MSGSIDDQIASIGGTGTGSGAGGTDWAGISKALGAGAGSMQKSNQQTPMPTVNAPAGQAVPGQASSGAYQGSTAGMNALAQMLMARVLALRDASNPASARPVNLQTQQKPAGLLGL